MTLDNRLQEIIKKKPHLTEPFRFYEKTMRFIDAVKRSGVAANLRLNAYSPEHSDLVFSHFAPLFDLPDGTLSPLRQALESGDLDFTRLPLLEIPAFSLPYAEDDLILLLFLLSRPYFISMREARSGDPVWEQGTCPVCQGKPVLVSSHAGGGFKAACSFCGSMGILPKASCPICNKADKAAIRTTAFDGDKGFRIRSCDTCRSYVKLVSAALLSRMGPDSADIASLPLDILVQQKGYHRRAPNPLGMLRMSTSG